MTGGRTAFLWNDEFLKYSFGEEHPFQPVRYKMTMDLLQGLGIFDDTAVKVIADSAAEEDLCLVHTREHVDFVKEMSERGEGVLDRGDTPATKELFKGSLAAVGATLRGMEGIMKGEFEHAFNMAGGLHHAAPRRSAGFCVFNDMAVAVRRLQKEHGVERVAIIDIDGHHGDGTQATFYAEKVLTISLHRHGRAIYPGTGRLEEVGERNGRGYSINVPLPCATGDRTYLEAYRRVVAPALESYEPEFIIHQFGVDGHYTDPLVGLGLTTHAYQELASITHDLAHKHCDGRYLVVGGGGYNLDAVPRCWSVMFCTMSGCYPADMNKFQALHDAHAPAEPDDVAQMVRERVDRIVYDALPLIRGR